MIFKLHFWLVESGSNAVLILLGVFLATYTDASELEIGILLMLMPFSGVVFRPIICSKADREQAYQKYQIVCLLLIAASYTPFVIIPLLGPAVYEEHPRACFYTLSALKIVGDVAFGGAASLGDALTINYTKRMGQNFAMYRIWGTVSWVCFGLIIGQINETPALPKLVPGFLILIVSTLLDAFIFYAWPPQYFEMVPMSELEVEARQLEMSKADHPQPLVPGEQVRAHIGYKLGRLLTLGLSKGRPPHGSLKRAPENKRAGSWRGQQPEEASLVPFVLSKRTQLGILRCLIRRDPRISLYCGYFLLAGASSAPLSFFFIHLKSVCQSTGSCDFSQLGGFMQSALATPGVLAFLSLAYLGRKLGRVNLCLGSLVLVACQFAFYTFVWYQVDPHWAVVAECGNGIMFAVSMTMAAEVAHLFANEVQHVLDELLQRRVVSRQQCLDSRRIKLSLAATMQALVGLALGLGTGIGSLACGYIIQQSGYRTLWWSLTWFYTGASVAGLLLQLYDHLLKPRLGLDVQHKYLTRESAA